MAMFQGEFLIKTIYHSNYNKNNFDLVEINGSKIALFSKKIESNAALTIDLSDYNVVFLAPLEAEKNITIKATSVIVLTTIHAKHGDVEINASGKFIMLGNKIEGVNTKINAIDKVFVCSLMRERLEMILEEFKNGISRQHGPTIADALTDTFDAIQNPSGENEEVSRIEAFKFFNLEYSLVKALEY